VEPVTISSAKLQVQLRQSKLIFEEKTSKKRGGKKSKKPSKENHRRVLQSQTINDCRQS